MPFAVFLLLTTRSRASCSGPRSSALAAGDRRRRGAAVRAELHVGLDVARRPAGVGANALAAFWFDTTKADWRETMVLGVGAGQADRRLAMWWLDARQQFGVAGLALAAVGAMRLWRISRAMGAAARRCAYVDHHGVRAHLQRRRRARVLPAGALPHRAVRRRGRARSLPSGGAGAVARRGAPLASPLGRCCCIAVRRLARLGHLAGRRSPRRPPRRAADRAADATASTTATRSCVSQMNWQSRTRCSTRRATSGRTSPGRGWPTCCRTSRSWSRTTSAHRPRHRPDRRGAPRTSSRAYGPCFRSSRTTRVPPAVARRGRGAAVPRGTPYVLALLHAAARRTARRRRLRGGARRR